MVIDGSPAAPVRVGPPTNHRLARIDRDAGVSVRLPDGSTVWFFGDTAERRPDSTLRFFEVGSAAWSAPGAPTVTLDHLVDGDRVLPFAEPTAEFPDCPAEAPTAGMWPLAAVADPSDPNRVLLWMGNICLGSNRMAVDRGISLGEWRYDPGDPPVDRPIEVTVLNQRLFPDGEFGEAAVAVGDHVVVYGCDTPANMLTATDAGFCRAARASVDEVTDASAYEVWDGEGWTIAGTPAPLDLASVPAGPSVPPGPVSVAATGDAFVMLYTPWPGYVPLVEVRVAREPQGPWSAPARIELPDCDDHYSGRTMSCYAANLQPGFDEPGRLGFGYYDQLIDTPPPLGSYLVSSIPFHVEPAG